MKNSGLGFGAHDCGQDLKDMMREAGQVLYTDVRGDGTGVVEFASESDMVWALKNLDGSKMKTHLVSPVYAVVLGREGGTQV